MRQRILLIAFLMTVCSYCMAVKRGYAVYTEEDKTITCYDDGKMSDKTGTLKLELDDVNGAGCGINGFNDNIKKVVEKVKFDPSFVSAKFGSITRWFSSMSALTTIEGLQYFDTSEVTTAKVVFNGCSSLETIDLSSLKMPKLQDAAWMFTKCGAKTIKLFKSGSAITSTEGMFANCLNLESINFNGLNTSQVRNMSYMFNECEKITSLNLSGFDTRNVTTMEGMFYLCTSLGDLNLSGFNTFNVTNMNCMFYECRSLESLDLSNFNTANVTDMYGMFCKCSSLIYIGESNMEVRNYISFDTNNVTDMSYMFYGCSFLSALNLSNFNTSNVTDMSKMFENCKSLTSISISSFDTSKTKNMSEMFNYCVELTTIYVGDKWTVAQVTDQSTYMFTNCEKLVGGAGTSYYNLANNNYNDACKIKYARIDGGTDTPGYLTSGGVLKLLFM